MFRACASGVCAAATLQASGGAEWVQRVPIRNEFRSDPVSGTPSGAGLARIGVDDYLVCDYIKISRLRKVNGQWNWTVLPPPGGVISWCPTGLFYTGSGKLYIANYRGNDLLVASMAPDSGLLTVEQRITHPAMRSPENVAASGSRIFAADYDGGAVFCFAADGSLIWRTECPQAHGLVVSEGGVYASSLQTREIIKIDGSGQVAGRQKQGGLGWAPGEYLWPVSLAATPRGGIAVLDAQAGRITELTSDLKPVRVIGSNGPGADHFNFPYALIADEGGYALADTLKGRIVFLTNEWEIKAQICPAGRSISLRGAPGFSGLPTAPYTYPGFPGLDILGSVGIQECGTANVFAGGFNSIDALGPGSQVTKELELDDPHETRAAGTAFWYMLWAMRVETGADDWVMLLGSPQKAACLAVDPSTGAFLELPFPGDAWPVNGALLLSDGSRYDHRAATNEAHARFSAIRALIASGVSRAEAYRQIVAPEVPQTLFFRDFWEKLLAGSEAGTRVARALARGEDLTGPAEEAYLHFLGTPQLLLREALAVRYLSAVRSKSKLVASGVCLRSPESFYPGHGLNVALNNELPDRYAAQWEGQGSHQFSIHLDPPKEMAALLLAWHSAAIPASFRVSFSSRDGKLLDAQEFAGNERLVTVIGGKPGVEVAEAQVAVQAFAGQDRLLIQRTSVFARGRGGLSRNEIEERCLRIAGSLEYSEEPLDSLPGAPSDIIRQNGRGRCGHFAYLLCDEIEREGGEARIWKIELQNGSAHSVVEALDAETRNWFVADPTLGITYDASVEEMLARPERATARNLSPEKRQRFPGYFGPAFWGGRPKSLGCFAKGEFEKLLRIASPDAVDIAPDAKVADSVPVYPGHGVENALDGDPDDDYVAALEGAMPQSFTLVLAHQPIVRRIEITWESNANYGIDYRIESLDRSGKLEGCLVQAQGRQDRIQILDIAEPRKCEALRFVVEKTAGQARLLLRQLKIYATP